MSVRGIDAEHYLLEVKLRRERVSAFDEFPFTLPVMRNFRSLELHPKVTFIIGENGSGKSTLLEAIAVAWGFNPEGGSKNFRFQTRASHSNLSQCLTLSKSFKRPKDGFFLRAESFFNVATEIERLDEDPGGPSIIGAYGGRSLHEQSHGESFLALMMKRFRGNGFYVLDEPEAALSPSRQLTFLARLHELVQSGSQFIIATHSPMITAYPDATIYQIESDGLVETAHELTSSFVILKRFLADPKAALEEVLGTQF